MSGLTSAAASAAVAAADPFAFNRTILHVAQPGSGGVAGFVNEVSAFQASHGWNVHVAGPQYDGDAPAKDVAKSAASSPVTSHLWDAVRNPMSGLVHESQQLEAIIDEVNPDVVVLHSAKAGLVGRTLLRGRIPTIYVPHAWSFLALPRPLAQNAVMWERAASRWTSLVVAVSEGEALLGVRSGVTAPMVIISNPAPTAWLDAPVTAPQQARRELGLPQWPTVVSVGRFGRQKGQDYLLAAWPWVRDVLGAAQLVLVGDGPEREQLEAAADGSIIFPGAQEQVRPWLQAADVVAMPSRWEGMALSMLEALASARSIVTHHVAGSDVVMRARAGAVVAVGDTRRFAEALVLRLQRPELAREEGIRGARYVAEHHSADQCFREFSVACLRAHAFGAPASRGGDDAPS